MARLQAIYNILELANTLDNLDKKRQRGIMRESVMQMNDEELLSNFHLSRSAFELLCSDIVPLIGQQRRGDIPTPTKVLSALSFYRTGGHQKLVGQNINAAMSQPSVSNAVRAVTDALNSPEILQKHIRFPQNRIEREQIAQGYYEKFGIPGVIGCIDGTHVAIIRPVLHEERYFNPRYYHSRNVQIICDSNMKILSVDASFGGASPDSYIWNMHPVKQHLEELNADGERNWLLGDSSYAQRTCLMTPIEDAVVDSPEAHYNKAHKNARDTIERTIAALKGRWRCLLAARELHYDPLTAGKIINACCVLHNICVDAGLPAPTLKRNEAILEERDQDRQVPADKERGETVRPGVDPRQRGNEARDRLVRELWEARGDP